MSSYLLCVKIGGMHYVLYVLLQMYKVVLEN